MNRTKKLIKYGLIILVYLVFRFYFGGFYFSKEKCEKDILRSIYATDDVYIMEFPKDVVYQSELLNGNLTRRIYFDPNDKTVSIVDIEKRGLLYHAEIAYIQDVLMYDTGDIVVIWNKGQKEGDFLLIYRNNPNVHQIEIERGDGSTSIWWGWKENFVGVFLDRNEGYYYHKCKAFDKQGNLITEIPY